MHVLAAQGSRARISRSIPFARTDDPSVAEEGSGHSATNEGEASMLRLDVIRPNSCFRKVEIQPRPIAYVPHQILRGQTGGTVVREHQRKLSLEPISGVRSYRRGCASRLSFGVMPRWLTRTQLLGSHYVAMHNEMSSVHSKSVRLAHPVDDFNPAKWEQSRRCLVDSQAPCPPLRGQARHRKEVEERSTLRIEASAEARSALPWVRTGVRP